MLVLYLVRTFDVDLAFKIVPSGLLANRFQLDRPRSREAGSEREVGRMGRSGRGSGLEKGGRDEDVDLPSVLSWDSHSPRDGPLRCRESLLGSFS